MDGHMVFVETRLFGQRIAGLGLEGKLGVVKDDPRGVARHRAAV